VSAQPTALVLGASGYVGGRLVPRLLAAGYAVRCLARTPAKLSAMPWASQAEIRRGDLLDEAGLDDAFAGVDVVFHLVHSMGTAREPFAEVDRTIAHTVARHAAGAGVRRIVYLGGLGEVDGDTSPHLRSRAEVGEILLDGSTPTTVLRAAVIIGSGSASFEMLRHLVERLPAMVCPRWIDTRVQPIAIRDVLRYLVAAAGQDDGRDHVYDIGGPDVMTYRDMMQRYARAAGLPRRVIVKVPFLTPRLSSHWVHWVTPVPIGLARPLIDSLTSEVVVTGGEDIRAIAPEPCLPYEEALRLAIRRIRDREVETSWRDAEPNDRPPAEPYPGDPEWTGGTLLRDVRSVVAPVTPEQVFVAVSGLGGARGWPTFMWAWQVRGLLDRLVGGVGLRRGRRDPERLRVGDAVDFWRVEAVIPPGGRGGVLRLRAEMRLPGRAWLEFRMDPAEAGTALTQRALFTPRGLLGRAYWYALVPFHGLIFGSMVRAIARSAARIDARAAAAFTSSGARSAPPGAPGGVAAAPGEPPAQPRRAG
jgi:uncharacterized protein YbjT (DUF2867 family)